MISVSEQVTAHMALEICRAQIASHPTLDYAQYLALERAVDKTINGEMPEETTEERNVFNSRDRTVDAGT